MVATIWAWGSGGAKRRLDCGQQDVHTGRDENSLGNLERRRRKRMSVAAEKQGPRNALCPAVFGNCEADRRNVRFVE